MDICNAMTDNAESRVVILGQPLQSLPRDLYIPPNALTVFLGVFTGPLDLLLYLIRKNNLDILDIPIAQITAQYMEYVALMKNINLELAAEYLVMAAMLAEIKSKMLLPRPSFLSGEEEDPRGELVRKLRLYEQFKKAAEELDTLPRVQRELFKAVVFSKIENTARPQPKLEWRELFTAFEGVMKRISMQEHYEISKAGLSIRERMSDILVHLQQNKFIDFITIFTPEEGRRGIVITFMAILELLRQNLIDIVQRESYGAIYLNAREEKIGD